MTWNQIKFGDPLLPNCLWDRYMEDEDGCCGLFSNHVHGR